MPHDPLKRAGLESVPSDTEPLFHNNSSTRCDQWEESMRQGHPVPDLKSTHCSSQSHYAEGNVESGPEVLVAFSDIL